ncbi:hypothetical protein MJO28_005403 [Puccinia striiformis f. sp. tritici]|uniref:Uncharacterized protein n=1 Tax=Puccinia striiformis f. sp. tritici TaxID=168172 RepID=A0ACC0EMG1_9BASI|nr:hypothetical protein MJO28_005403 [Puccinia striiformis f. sp. tritici]
MNCKKYFTNLPQLIPDWNNSCSSIYQRTKEIHRNYHHSEMDKSTKKTSSEPAAPPSSNNFKCPLSGLFAINKPSGVTSMSLLEAMKELFFTSKLFVENPEPYEIQTGTNENGKGKKSRKNKYWQKKNQAKAIKVGQGGTLDPLASGVLIIGLNSATKKLSNCLDCSKSYRTIGILGCKTDSYDSDGKVVGLSSWKHVKPEEIRKECQSIKGEHWQIPPIYSALKMDGKPLYEYARNNIPLPRPIEARRCQLLEIEMVDWKESGEHSYKWPTEMISEEESKIFQLAENLVKQTGIIKSESTKLKNNQTENGPEKFNESTKREPSLEQEENNPKKVKLVDGSSGNSEAQSSIKNQPVAPESKDVVTMDDNGKSPVFTLEMTVSSGTYVRTIVHDIGQAVSSAATVVSLIRTRQGDFSLDTESDTSNRTGGSKTLPCIDWSVFEKAIQSRSNGSDYPPNEAGLRKWEQELLKHIQVS